MTKEEAIDILQGAIKKPNTKDGYLGQAIDMAIKALEQERSRLAQITQYRNDCEKLMQENEQLKKALKQEPILDKIRAEIEEIIKLYEGSCDQDFGIKWGYEGALEIIDEYRGEQCQR